MRIYNTLSGKKEELKAPSNGVNLFVCGPTVYDYSHIGHARTYIFFDAFVKFLRHRLGLKVNYLQNITDLDDKIIQRAADQNKNWSEIAKTFDGEYRADMASIGVNSVDTYAPATKYIPEMISQIERLIKKGYAYQSSGDSNSTGSGSVYFDVRKFPEYGKLSHQKLGWRAELGISVGKRKTGLAHRRHSDNGKTFRSALSYTRWRLGFDIPAPRSRDCANGISFGNFAFIANLDAYRTFDV